MLDNLKAAIFQRKKFLVVFFFVVFLPSLLLAALGIRAIYNEKYKLEQQALDQHREFLAEIKAEIVTFIDTKSSELRELASDPSMDERDLGAIRNLVLTGLRNELLSGEIVIWNAVTARGSRPSKKLRRPIPILLSRIDGGNRSRIWLRRKPSSSAAANSRKPYPCTKGSCPGAMIAKF